MLLTLLLQTSTHPVFIYIGSTMGVLGFLFAVFSWLRRENREDKQAREAVLRKELDELWAANDQFEDKDALKTRFEANEKKHALLATDVLNQHNTLHEYERERERLTGEFRGAITQLQKESRALEPLPGQVADLKAKFEALSNQITDVKADIRSNKQELKEDMKSNKIDILAAIKELKIHP